MKSTLKAKLQHMHSKTHRMFALTLFMFFISWMPASQAACSIHDQLCIYHVGDAAVRAGAVANTGTSLVMYAVGTNPSTTTASTVDFDTLGKMPANTGDKFLVGSPINYTTPTGPYIVNSTAYGTTHPPTTWNIPGDAVLQVAPSQYQLTFNQNTAIAKHTGDFNGGENGNIPGATGCPNMPAGTKNCEAVVVTGNVPNGIYEQKVTLFNYFNEPNPQVQLQVGAYTTGRAVIISNSHESTEQAYFPILSGTGATTPAYQYEVYNLGFDPHAKGTALFDQNKYSTRYSNTYEAGDHRFRDAYFTTLTTHNKVNADGWNDKTYTAKTSVEKQYMGEVPKPPVPKVFCTDGKSSISCGTPGAVDYNSQAARSLEANFQRKIVEDKQQEFARRMDILRQLEVADSHANTIAAKATPAFFERTVISIKKSNQDIADAKRLTRDGLVDDLSTGFNNAATYTAFIPGVGQVAAKVETGIAVSLQAFKAGDATYNLVTGSAVDAQYYQARLIDSSIELIDVGIDKFSSRLPNSTAPKKMNAPVDVGSKSTNPATIQTSSNTSEIKTSATIGDKTDLGFIYYVDGKDTRSGRPYVGSTNNMENRKKETLDGRNRDDASITGFYDRNDRLQRRVKEQQAILDAGGVDSLDNKRNEVAEKNWDIYNLSK